MSLLSTLNSIALNENSTSEDLFKQVFEKEHKIFVDQGVQIMSSLQHRIESTRSHITELCSEDILLASRVQLESLADSLQEIESLGKKIGASIEENRTMIERQKESEKALLQQIKERGKQPPSYTQKQLAQIGVAYCRTISERKDQR